MAKPPPPPPRRIDRSDWEDRVLKRNPEISQLKQSIEPLERFQSFMQLYAPGKEVVRQQLTEEHIIKLILQHLSFYGLNASVQVLSKESKVEFEDENLLTESRLLYFMRKSLKEVESIYNLTIADHELPEGYSEGDLEEILYNMELIDIENDIPQTENVNIWDEPQEGNIIFEKDGQIKCATLNKLVEYLTNESTEMEYVQTFLMTYQSFVSAENLFSKLLERFNVPEHIDQVKASIVIVKMGNVLRKWFEDSSDFTPDLVKRRDAFIRQLQYSENKTVSALSSSLRNAIKRSEKAGKDLDRMFSHSAPEPKVSMKSIFSPVLSFIDLDEEEIARQLCIIEFRIFSKIRPSELLDQAWSKAKSKHRAINVLKMIARFNTTSMWVATNILQQSQLRIRVKIYAKFVKIAEHLLSLNNFNGAMAIIAALNWASIHRLTWTRKELPPRTVQSLEDMEKLLGSESAYKTYRYEISNRNPPCIPYLGVYLTDLTFIDENPNTVNGLINFAKRKMIYNVISRIQQYQNTHYNLQPVEQIIQLLLKVTPLDEQTLYSTSLKREPRNADRSQIL